jgi:hypothetical protein
LYFFFFLPWTNNPFKEQLIPLGSLIALVLILPSVYHKPLFLLGLLFALKMEVVVSSETVGIYLPNYMVSHFRIL